MDADRGRTQALRAVVVLSIAQAVLTTLHHVYGALLFDTPQRLHMLAAAPPYVLAVAIAYRGAIRPVARRGRAFGSAIVASSWLLPLGVIGVFEGGYNHLLKNVLFFAGIDRARFEALYPGGLLYEAPSDLWFEASGIAQFVVALFLMPVLLEAGARLRAQRAA